MPAPPQAVLPSAGELRFEGRFEGSDSAGPRFQWPGSTVWLRFVGTDAHVTLTEHSMETDEYGQVAHDWYDVEVDGQPARSFQAAEGKHAYPLAQGLRHGEHLIALRKRTEAFVGQGQLLGFEIDAGARLLPAAGPGRRIEFIGDSITAGFGVAGADATCLFSADTEDYSLSYAALTSQALGAEQIAVASAGAGVYRNWMGTLQNTMGDLYQRTLPTDPQSRWDFSRWTPDAVVINLGTADFTSGDPGADAFVGAYRLLLARVRQNYPSALIVVALGPMLSNLWPVGANALTQARAYLTQVTAEANAAGDARVVMIEFPDQDGAQSFGCKAHPSSATQARVAAQLSDFLRRQLSW